MPIFNDFSNCDRQPDRAPGLPPSQVPPVAIWQVFGECREGIAFVDSNNGAILWHNAAFQEAYNAPDHLQGQNFSTVITAGPPIGLVGDENMRLIEVPGSHGCSRADAK